SITADNMADKVGVTKRAIEKSIKSLRDMGILVHEGSDKAGYWRIIVKP
ncbi:HTH domain-containing protein, partial [uncultured Bacteroides sp.]